MTVIKDKILYQQEKTKQIIMVISECEHVSHKEENHKQSMGELSCTVAQMSEQKKRRENGGQTVCRVVFVFLQCYLWHLLKATHSEWLVNLFSM